MTFGTYSSKTGKCWEKTFLSGTCAGMVLVIWAGLDFDWDPLTLDHAPFLPKNAQNRAKSNPIFHLNGRRDGALILRFLDSPMPEFSFW